MRDRLDVPMHDAEVLEEIELTSELMIAATEADGPLEQTQIDRILGVLPAGGPALSGDGTQPTDGAAPRRPANA